MSFKSKLLVFILLVSAAGIYVVGIDPVIYGLSAKGPSEPVHYIEVAKGARMGAIAEQLQTLGIIESAPRFHRLGRLYTKFRSLKAGEYQVRPNQTAFEILRVLTSGVSSGRPITIKEGDNLYQVASVFEQQGLASARDVVALCHDRAFIATFDLEPAPATLEGFLYPETYFFNKTQSLREMLGHMVRKHLAYWTPERLQRAQALGLSRHQAVTLASMVEKETGAPEERPMISSVFHNRLKKRMRLQSDPTTIYGIWTRYKGNLRRSDLIEKTPYNTYAIAALPIGPISNPGAQALDATLQPIETEFLYFVSRNDGTHYFSKTFAEHDAAVKRFQLDPKAREGKSWRDLSKRPATP